MINVSYLIRSMNIINCCFLLVACSSNTVRIPNTTTVQTSSATECSDRVEKSVRDNIACISLLKQATPDTVFVDDGRFYFGVRLIFTNSIEYSLWFPMQPGRTREDRDKRRWQYPPIGEVRDNILDQPVYLILRTVVGNTSPPDTLFYNPGGHVIHHPDTPASR